MSKNVAITVVEALRDIGVKHVFGVPSGGWVDYMEALRITDGIEFILATHEGGAAMMADMCGRITGVPGVCFGTYGPGATNLSTGVGGAQLDRSPLIALTDEMPEPLRGRTVQMGIDHQALFRPITKHTTRLSVDNVRQTIFNAARMAMSERPGAVHVGLPVGLSAELVPQECINSFDSTFDEPPASQAALDQMCEHIRRAKRPVIALGLGAVRAGVSELVLDIAEQLQAPIHLTPMAKGMVPESHPNYAGVLFHALSDIVGETHKQADLVVAVGYDPVEFNIENWAPNVPIVNIDTEAADIDRSQFPIVVDVVGGIAKSLNVLSESKLSASDWDIDEIGSRMSEIFEKMQSEEGSFGACAILETLREVFPENGVMTCDVGAHTHLIGQKWITPKPGLQVMTNGWSTMGFGIPSAIGAKLCEPDVPVCSVVGDGGFLMTVAELATAVRYNISFVTVVITDNDLALIRIKQERKDNPIYGTPIRDVGTIGGENLFGVPVLKAADKESLREALHTAFAANKPMIVEACSSDSLEYDELVLKKDKTD